jgi:hypothetical protein
MDRIRFWAGVLGRAWVVVIAGLWSAFSNFTVFRDNILPMTWRGYLDVPEFTRSQWIFGLLVIGFCAVLEGSYRVVSGERERFVSTQAGLKERIATLEAVRDDPVEEARRSHVRGVLGTFTDGEKSAIKHLLTVGKMSLRDFVGTGLNDATPMRNKARSGSLLDEERNTHGEYLYSVKPELRAALSFVLHEGQS